MLPYQSYQQWQIERPKSAREQRSADRQAAELAAAVSGLVRGGGWRRLATGVRVARQPRPAAQISGFCNTEG